MFLNPEPAPSLFDPRRVLPGFNMEPLFALPEDEEDEEMDEDDEEEDEDDEDEADDEEEDEDEDEE